MASWSPSRGRLGDGRDAGRSRGVRNACTVERPRSIEAMMLRRTGHSQSRARMDHEPPEDLTAR